MAEHAHITTTPEAHWEPQRAMDAGQRRLMMETALDRLLDAVQGILADLDALDGDPDFELEGMEVDADFEPSMP